jgi:hypothetical protein
MNDVVEKDNTWLIVGLCIVAMIVVVIFLRSEKSAHLEDGAVAQLQAETFANLEKRKTKNMATEDQKAGK